MQKYIANMAWLGGGNKLNARRNGLFLNCNFLEYGFSLVTNHAIVVLSVQYIFADIDVPPAEFQGDALLVF